ncbi:MAG: hypothetical protein QM775_09075 [Pirellulales bacterium]
MTRTRDIVTRRDAILATGDGLIESMRPHISDMERKQWELQQILGKAKQNRAAQSVVLDQMAACRLALAASNGKDTLAISQLNSLSYDLSVLQRAFSKLDLEARPIQAQIANLQKTMKPIIDQQEQLRKDGDRLRTEMVLHMHPKAIEAPAVAVAALQHSEARSRPRATRSTAVGGSSVGPAF